jgi:hypothetical protein
MSYGGGERENWKRGTDLADETSIKTTENREKNNEEEFDDILSSQTLRWTFLLAGSISRFADAAKKSLYRSGYHTTYRSFLTSKSKHRLLFHLLITFFPVSVKSRKYVCLVFKLQIQNSAGQRDGSL